MTLGYYLPATRSRHGDPNLARLARILWRKLGHRHPSRVDGVSIWLGEAGYVVRLMARDLFGNDVRGFGDYPAFEVPGVRVHDR